MSALKFVTFNIRNTWKYDGINNFLHRAGSILYKLDVEQPDVVCFQEVFPETAEFLSRHLPAYEVLYRGRDKNLGSEGLAIAIRRETVELMSTDCFWLSPTPYVPGSRFEEQSDCPRICQTAMLRRKADKQVFWVYNNHLDHISDQARILGIHKVLDRVSGDQQKFAFPVFICGDFNARSDSETIRYCENYADFPIVELNKGCGLTCHNYGTYKMGDPYDHIDYIYVNKETAANPYTVTVWTDTTDGIWLSDHYPICAEVELGNT